MYRFVIPSVLIVMVFGAARYKAAIESPLDRFLTRLAQEASEKRMGLTLKSISSCIGVDDMELWREVTNAQLHPIEIAAVNSLSDQVEGRRRVYRCNMEFPNESKHWIYLNFRLVEKEFYCESIVVKDYPGKGIDLSLRFIESSKSEDSQSKKD